MICKKEKERIYNNLERLIRQSFEEGTDDIYERLKIERIEAGEDPEEVDVFDVVKAPDFKFKSEYLLRSSHFWGIDHFLQYVKNAIEKN